MQLREIREDEYRRLYKHMKRDFPASELPPYFAIKSNLEKKVYSGFFLNDGQDIGYALVTTPEDYRFALINFFAILPEFRSSGYGTVFIELICDRCAGYAMILEAEDPAAAKTDKARVIAERRVQFYERAGFRILPTARARIFGVDMVIMTNTSADTGNVKSLMHSLYLPAFSSKKWLRFINIRDVL